MKFFHKINFSEMDTEKIISCLSRIKKSVSEKCGISNFIDYDDNTIAFAGTKKEMKLVLEIFTQKFKGKNYLIASIDDDISWYESDFENITDFEESIVKYISDRVNKTIKTVIKNDNNGVTIESYYLTGDGKWICFESERVDVFFVSKITKSTETIKSYYLDL